MLEVNIEKIIPVTDARDSLNKIIDEVSASDEMYVLTVNGKPSAVIVGVHHLEKLTGKNADSFGSFTSSDPAPVEVPVAGAVAPAVEEPAVEPAAGISFNPADSLIPTPAPAPTETTFSDPTLPPVTPTVAPAPTEDVTPTVAPAPAAAGQFVTPDVNDLGANATATVQDPAANDLFN